MLRKRILLRSVAEGNTLLFLIKKCNIITYIIGLLVIKFYSFVNI
jgi:hypothetical protein